MINNWLIVFEINVIKREVKEDLRFNYIINERGFVDNEFENWLNIFIDYKWKVWVFIGFFYLLGK